MKVIRFCGVGLVIIGAILAAASPRMARAQSNPMHGAAYWHAIQKKHYAVPEGESAVKLAHELSAYLGSPDPELRDDIAYSVLDVWILRRPELSREELLPFLEEWSANLKIGVGESGNDSVLKRSFSALCLASVAERELRTPFMGEARYRALLTSAIAYLNAERDLRGYDAKKGWIHATAHTADLLKALAQHDLLSLDDQHAILDSIERRLSTAHEVYAYGEQDRLALAVKAIIARKDFDGSYFEEWLKRLDAADAAVWKEKPLTPGTLNTLQNRNYMLEALAARLSGEKLSANGEAAQAALLRVIAEQ